MKTTAPTSKSLAHQRGHTVLIALVGVVVVIAVLIFFNERSRATAKAERQRIEAVQRQEAENAEKARVAAAQRERQALEEQAQKAEQAQRDVLVQALKKFDDVVVRFYDASRIAGSTSRIALAQPVATMQALHREASQIPAPPCLALGRDDLMAAMKEMVDGYIVFMQNPAKMGDELAGLHFKAAEPSIAKYRESRVACPVP